MGHTVTEQELLAALRKVQDHDLHSDIVSLGVVRNVNIHDSRVSFDLVLPTPVLPGKETMRDEAMRLARGLPGVSGVDVSLKAEVRGHATPDNTCLLYTSPSPRD